MRARHFGIPLSSARAGRARAVRIEAGRHEPASIRSYSIVRVWLAAAAGIVIGHGLGLAVFT